MASMRRVINMSRLRPPVAGQCQRKMNLLQAPVQSHPRCFPWCVHTSHTKQRFFLMSYCPIVILSSSCACMKCPLARIRMESSDLNSASHAMYLSQNIIAIHRTSQRLIGVVVCLFFSLCLFLSFFPRRVDTERDETQLNERTNEAARRRATKRDASTRNETKRN